ncbi:hypothetical protein KP509_22G037100 [Ceratopteris richardii]|uniref:Uncharacterized protein n=1 Tax=Ceratopteris richardii TaxID=49495 RepID=A0A8T2S529_CERRI|nr:hypothetical protein KP509_22G037100 [Ceratopteris richardii]
MTSFSLCLCVEAQYPMPIPIHSRIQSLRSLPLYTNIGNLVAR